MSLPKSTAFRGASPKASSSPSITHAHDELTLSVSSSTTISDPQTQLLRRWRRLSEQISRARLSCNAVIMLNRSLDLAEEMVIHGAAMDEDWKTVETTEGSEIHRPLSSGINAGMVGEPVASLTDAQEDGAERMGRQDPKEYEYVLDRVTKAVGLLRYRQQDLKRLHERMMMRIENQAENIHRLHLRANCLQQDIVDDESELTYLKLQLRIIEVQTLPYWPRKDQDELAAGIERWKRDWADVDERYRKRRWKRQADNAHHLGSDSSADIGTANLYSTE